MLLRGSNEQWMLPPESEGRDDAPPSFVASPDLMMGAVAAQQRYRPVEQPWLPDVGQPLIPSGPQISEGTKAGRFVSETLPRAVGQAAVQAVSTPGALMQPNPYPEGSEEWHWYNAQNRNIATQWAPEMALNTMGTGAFARLLPGGVPDGAVLGSGPVSRMPSPEAPGELAKMTEYKLPRAQPAARSTEIPNIRGLSVDDAVAIARKQPHLIKAGGQSEGFYVGAPREMQSKKDLTKARTAFDEYVALDPRGGDWYDRYRSGVTRVTGGDPVHNKWMSSQEGQWSAGVDPGSEFHFAVKENNAAIAGMPVKAARPAQHEAHLRALQARDPSLYQLGDKTGEYAELVNPDVVYARPPGATGVNDFRHARNWGYTEADGGAQKGALTDAQHRFLDHETALAVARANAAKLGGRSNWTGEQIQAAPWVRQKALAIQERGGKDKDGNFKLSYEEAFERANKTIADYFPRHTAFATYEAQPGSAVTGHLPGGAVADQAARDAFALDPRSSWATAPGGRDAIYAGLGIEGTGNYMRVLPTQRMQGFYETPAGVTETNLGETARPLVTFDTPTAYDKAFVGPQQPEPFKTLTPHDRAILDAGEAVRGYFDAQNASAAHKVWAGGPANQSNSLFFPRSGPAAPGELFNMQNAGKQFGLNYVSDTGQGVTMTNFSPSDAAHPDLGRALRKGEFDQFGEPHRVRVDSVYTDYTDKFSKPGSGEATREMLNKVSATPELRDAFNRNAYIPERAMARLERDTDWRNQWGLAREDIQTARRIVGEGPGWVDRLEAALKAGVVLPALAAAIFAGAQGRADERS